MWKVRKGIKVSLRAFFCPALVLFCSVMRLVSQKSLYLSRI